MITRGIKHYFFRRPQLTLHIYFQLVSQRNNELWSLDWSPHLQCSVDGSTPRPVTRPLLTQPGDRVPMVRIVRPKGEVAHIREKHPGNKKTSQHVNSLWSSDARWGQQMWVKISSGNGLLPDGAKPLSDPMLTYNQRCFMAITWWQ